MLDTGGQSLAGKKDQAPDGRLSPLASVPATRAVLERHGLATKKALGQHFLVSDGVVRHICELAELDPQDNVLEIGPGIGTLTCALLQRAGKVVAVERDGDLIDVLAETCGPWADRLDVLHKDALDLVPGDLSVSPGKLVSNLPYAVAATLVLDAFERFESLESATVMVQSEVAARMAAKPGTKDYGAFTVKLALLARPAGRFSVPPGNFFPPPRVNSTVIRLDRIDRGLTPQVLAAAATIADAAFATRRKTIANSCRTYFAGRGARDGGIPDIDTLLAAASIDPKRRGETLAIDEFVALGQVLAQAEN